MRRSSRGARSVNIFLPEAWWLPNTQKSITRNVPAWFAAAAGGTCQQYFAVRSYGCAVRPAHLLDSLLAFMVVLDHFLPPDLLCFLPQCIGITVLCGKSKTSESKQHRQALSMALVVTDATCSWRKEKAGSLCVRVCLCIWFSDTPPSGPQQAFMELVD